MEKQDRSKCPWCGAIEIGKGELEDMIRYACRMVYDWRAMRPVEVTVICASHLKKQRDILAADNATLTARCAALEGALEPFAAYLDRLEEIEPDIPDAESVACIMEGVMEGECRADIFVEDLRNARALLTGEGARVDDGRVRLLLLLGERLWSEYVDDDWWMSLPKGDEQQSFWAYRNMRYAIGEAKEAEAIAWEQAQTKEAHE